MREIESLSERSKSFVVNIQGKVNREKERNYRIKRLDRDGVKRSGTPLEKSVIHM